jgi:hypothetical protein
MIKWFAANNLVLNLDKTNIMQFITKNSAHSPIQFGYKEKYIAETLNTKFVGLQTDNHINWKKNDNDITQHNITYFIKFFYIFFLSLFSVILLLPNEGNIYQVL